MTTTTTYDMPQLAGRIIVGACRLRKQMPLAITKMFEILYFKRLELKMKKERQQQI